MDYNLYFEGYERGYDGLEPEDEYSLDYMQGWIEGLLEDKKDLVG